MMCANTLYATLSKGAFILLLHLHCRTLKSTAWRKQLKKTLARAQMKRSVKSLSGILICLIFFSLFVLLLFKFHDERIVTC